VSIEDGRSTALIVLPQNNAQVLNGRRGLIVAVITRYAGAHACCKLAASATGPHFRKLSIDRLLELCIVECLMSDPEQAIDTVA
jgi:hypothetical protein